MKVRIITAVVAVTCIFPFFWFSDPVGATNPLNYLFPLLIAAISFVAEWELLHCLGLDKKYYISVPLYVVAFAMPMLARVMVDMREEYTRAAVLVALAYAIYLFGVVVFRFGKEGSDMGKLALLYMASFYVIGGLSAVVLLRDEGSVGRFLFQIPFVFAWVIDTFAYFCGRLFGKHKLIPAVSPKKTVEGAVGGAIFGAVTAVLYGVIVNACFDEVTPNYVALILGGLAIAVVSQMGDLIMSAIKRQYGVKDFGKMLPGHGGLLDRFDSSIAVALLVMIINTYFPLFTVA